jgi:hypothetical protein
MAVVTQIQVRRGTASQWTATNPVLAAGEWGYESDTNKAKIGNGSSAWNSLSYFGGTGTVSSITAGTGLSGGTITSTGTIAIDTATTVDVSTAQTLTNKTLTAPVINLSLNAQTGTTYTFALSDNGKLVTASNAGAQTYSIPTNGTTAFPTGTQINIIGINAGVVTIQAASSGTTTVASTGATAAAPVLRTQYSSATLIKVATDLWYVIGDIA